MSKPKDTSPEKRLTPAAVGHDEGDNCEKCKTAGAGTGVRWVLSDETAKCIWESPTSMPEVDVEIETVLDYYCSQQHAIEAAEEYMSKVGGRVQWSDVRPIETCASCNEDFDTTKWHRVLVLSSEEGPYDSPEILDIAYVARFCSECVP